FTRGFTIKPAKHLRRVRARPIDLHSPRRDEVMILGIDQPAHVGAVISGWLLAGRRKTCRLVLIVRFLSWVERHPKIGEINDTAHAIALAGGGWCTWACSRSSRPDTSSSSH